MTPRPWSTALLAQKGGQMGLEQENSLVPVLFHSDDFVTTFFIGFSNDSQTWVMYTNGYEEMVSVPLSGPG